MCRSRRILCAANSDLGMVIVYELYISVDQTKYFVSEHNYGLVFVSNIKKEQCTTFPSWSKPENPILD